jgi:hypothetical protein
MLSALESSQLQLEQVGVGILPLSAPMQNELDSALTRWIMNSSKSFFTVENEDFLDLFKLACPRYKVPNRRLLREMVLSSQIIESKSYHD